MKKLIAVMAVILCVFTAAAVGFTYVGIKLARGETILQTEEKGIDLSATYDENDLIIESVTEDYGGVQITLPKISGLKDTDVQERINSDMYSRIHSKLKEFETVEHAGFYTRANFANTISLTFSLSDGRDYDILCLNYELIKGKRLKLEDVFVQGTDILAMVRRGFFEDFVTMGDYDRESGLMEYDENTLYKTVKNFMAQDEKSFGFSATEVYFYYDDSIGSVNMAENAQSIGIYSKYVTNESIFEKDGVGFDGAFTCSDTTSYKSLFSKIEYGFAESNMWYDITVWKPYIDEGCPAEKLEAFEKFREGCYGEYDRQVELCREKAVQNPDKFYILMMKPGVDMYTARDSTDGSYVTAFSNAASVSANTKLYEMPIELYRSKYKEKLAEAYRYQYFAMAGGAFIEAEDSEVTLTSTSDEGLVNYISGEKYTDTESVFKDDSYKETLHREAVKWMTGMGKTPVEAESLVPQLEYRINGWGIKAVLPGETEETAFVSFAEFERDTLTFFD